VAGRGDENSGHGSEFNFEGGFMLAIIAAVLVVLWLLGFTAFHVTSGFIHVLLILAVISLVLHFFRGRASVA
jgi:undecaprenyl pyrophosphate phosphatase UppP